MRKYNLISSYTKRRKTRKAREINTDNTPNVLNREFNNKNPLEVVVSDLTYVKINNKWHYICLLIDLHAREIIGSAVGNKHNSELVQKAFYNAKIDLRNINLFHTDRGTEFKNKAIDNILKAFGIKRSLSDKGTPYDEYRKEVRTKSLGFWILQSKITETL